MYKQYLQKRSNQVLVNTYRNPSLVVNLNYSGIILGMIPATERLRYIVAVSLIGIQSEVWIINHCLGLGHEKILCAICLTMFLWPQHQPSHDVACTGNETCAITCSQSEQPFKMGHSLVLHVLRLLRCRPNEILVNCFVTMLRHYLGNTIDMKTIIHWPVRI